MKKNILMMMLILSVFALTSCSSRQMGETTQQDDEWITAAEVDITDAKLRLVPSSETAKAGNTLTVTLSLTDCIWFTDMTVRIYYPAENAVFVSGETLFAADNFYDAVNAENGEVYYSLLTQNAETLNGDCAKFTFALDDNIPAGTVLNFGFADGCAYSASSDALGVNVKNITDEILFIPCTVTIE